MDVCEAYSFYRNISQNSVTSLADPFARSNDINTRRPNVVGKRAKFLSWTAPRSISDFIKWYGCDGPADDESEDNHPIVSTLPRTKSSKKASTLRRPPLPSRFGSSSKSSSSSSLNRRFPDRFLPSRPGLNSATESFRSNKDPQDLTTDERLARTDSVSPDAFHHRRRATSPMINAARPIPRRNFSGNRSGSGGGTVLAFRRDPNAPNGERQVSIGTVWRVGGLAPVTGVPDGRGGLLGSGTNAPLYTTTFSATKPKVQEDLERLENRLAEALELDRASRILEFRHSLPPEISPKKTRWDPSECQWITSEPQHKSSKLEEVRNLPLAPFK